MTITERLNLFFYKSKCIKVIIVDVNKRLNTYIVKKDDNDYFSIGSRTYAVSFNAVYISNGIPAYIYYYDNPSAITQEELAFENLPLDMKNTKKKPKVTSADFYNAIEESLLSKIIRYAEDGDKKIINSVYIMGGINLLAIVGGLYYLYTMIDSISIIVLESFDLLQAIKDAIINGVGN